jgi:hypothetical protein
VQGSAQPGGRSENCVEDTPKGVVADDEVVGGIVSPSRESTRPVTAPTALTMLERSEGEIGDEDTSADGTVDVKNVLGGEDSWPAPQSLSPSRSSRSLCTI